MNQIMMNMKKTVTFVFAGVVLLTAVDYYLIRKEKKRWNISWNLSSSAFQVSGKKASHSKK